MTSWLRKRRIRRSRSSILQSSAVGLIHFPETAIEPETAARASRRRPRVSDDPFADDEARAVGLPRPRRIVVGVTHDRAGRNALRWAARAALSGDATLVVVTAYTVPCPVPTIYGWAYIDAQTADDTAQFMQRNVLCDELRGQQLTRRIRPVVARGDPTSVLVAAAKRADLLVIGRHEGRNRPSIARSVSKGCMRNAACPVVVVRDDLREEPLSTPSIRRVLAPPCTLGDVVDLRSHRDRTRSRFELRRHMR